MDIIFLYCPYGWVETPLVSLGYLCSYLKKQNFSVSVLDINIEVFNNFEKRSLWGVDNSEWVENFFVSNAGLIEKIVRRVFELSPRIVGFSVWDGNLQFSKRLAKELKEQLCSSLIVFGGAVCVIENIRDSLYEVADFVVVGEGEEILCELLEYSYSCNNFTEFKKYIFGKRNEEPMDNCISNLNMLPPPTYEEFELLKYNNFNNTGRIVMPIVTSRGCCYRCSFCRSQRPYRLRQIDLVCGEILYHIQRYDPLVFSFYEALINGNIDYLDVFCDTILLKQIKFKWTAPLVITSNLNKEFFLKLKKAGCIALNLGLESGSDRILRDMKKPYQRRDVERVLELVCQSGIETEVNFIVGYPGEKEDDFNETIEFFRRNNKYITRVISLNACNIYPDTPLYKKTAEYGICFDGVCYDWFIEDENTLTIRQNRLDRFRSLIVELGYKLP